MRRILETLVALRDALVAWWAEVAEAGAWQPDLGPWLLALVALLMLAALRRRRPPALEVRPPQLLVTQGEVVPDVVADVAPRRRRRAADPAAQAGVLTMTVSNLGRYPVQLLEVALRQESRGAPRVAEVEAVVPALAAVDVSVRLPLGLSGDGWLDIYCYAAAPRHKLHRHRAELVWEPWVSRFKVAPMEQSTAPTRRLASDERRAVVDTPAPASVPPDDVPSARPPATGTPVANVAGTSVVGASVVRASVAASSPTVSSDGDAPAADAAPPPSGAVAVRGAERPGAPPRVAVVRRAAAPVEAPRSQVSDPVAEVPASVPAVPPASAVPASLPAVPRPRAVPGVRSDTPAVRAEPATIRAPVPAPPTATAQPDASAPLGTLWAKLARAGDAAGGSPQRADTTKPAPAADAAARSGAGPRPSADASDAASPATGPDAARPIARTVAAERGAARTSTASRAEDTRVAKAPVAHAPAGRAPAAKAAPAKATAATPAASQPPAVRSTTPPRPAQEPTERESRRRPRLEFPDDF